MAEQIREPKQKRSEKKVEEPEPIPETKQETHDKHLADIDAMLDEIDEVLEKEAELFVREFVQKGGQ